MWRLTVRPSRDSALDPVDVVVDAAPGTRVGDLATQLGEHLAGPGSRILLAPTSEGRPWAAGEALADCDLRDGDVLDVTDVADQWLSRPAAPRTLRAHVRVVDGPDAGTVVPADSDVVVLGRSARCTVRLSDPTVSREHARVLLAADPVVVDQGSAHGTFLDGRAVTGAQQAGWNTPIRLGRTTVVLVPAGAAVPARPAAVLRSPRFGPQVVPAEHDLPVPPSAPRKQPLPWPMMLMPLLMGGAMFATTRSTFSLIFMLGFPLMMLTSHLIQRRSARVEHEGEVVAWRTEVAEVMAQLDADARVQREQTLEDEPELDEVVARAAGKHHDVWNRQPDEDDFLHVRVGRGPRPALVTAKVPTSGDRALRAELAEAATRRATLSELPVPVRFADGGLTAVVGPDGDVDELLRALLVRLAVAHSPTDVAVRAVLGPERAHVESWLRWLPHAANGAEGSVAIGAARGQELLEALAAGTGPGHTVCLVDDGVGLPRRLVEAVAALGNEHLHLVWLGSDLHAVPAATGTALDVAAMQLLTARRGGVEPLTTLDRLDLASAWKAARHLTAYRDEAAVAAAELLLPPSVRLPEVSGDLRDPDDVGGVLERWASSTGLRAQLGAGADGPVTIDLREDGPHGLVAGTTGSGKSELLQSLICSLAMNNPPSRITFLLVDYKGGAAFRECADLPHSVGYITDLTPALVQRALVSLHAELTHREHLLAQHGAKDLVALERSHPEVAPPSMLICVDEFAALLAEVPEFVDGMVSIAQRGRSLGMHMLLATQRPAGVVTPQIKANTDLRIALRVASPEDSSDVIDSPDAAQLSRRTPGRAWLRRTGHGTRELVQVAWVGAHEERHEAGTAVRVEPFTALGRSGSAGRTGHLDPRTDLERLVETATTAFGRTGARPPRKPWLPPLPHDLALGLPGERIVLVPGTAPDAQDELLVAGTRADAHTVRAQDGQVVLGLRDDPARQTQEPWAVDYARVGHLLVFGASGSGKTELLRTLGASASASGEPGAPGAIVYGIDAGGGGLGVLETLPSVGSVVTDRAIERVLRLVRLLHRTVVERNEAMAARGVADLAGLADTGVQRIH
ncbi:MAG: FtsK/SpoIIIE domain-containing protein, partial [Cellulomonadaceae bacterium]